MEKTNEPITLDRSTYDGLQRAITEATDRAVLAEEALASKNGCIITFTSEGFHMDVPPTVSVSGKSAAKAAVEGLVTKLLGCSLSAMTELEQENTELKEKMAEYFPLVAALEQSRYRVESFHEKVAKVKAKLEAESEST